MAAAYVSGHNTFVPVFDASGHLVINFSRNEKSFPHLQYVTLTPVKKTRGYYLEITREEAARVLSADLKQYVWAPGADAPTGVWSGEAFEFKDYHTQRYVFPYRIDYEAAEQADWEILASHGRIYAAQAMTARSRQVITVATTSANYGTHTDTATNLGGAKFDAGTPTAPALRKGLAAAAEQIHLATLGVVQPDDLMVVMNPTTARTIAASEEIHAYVKESMTAIAVLSGKELATRNGKWGLPDNIYGFKLVIEDTVLITTPKGQTATPQYAWPDGTIAVLARPGGLTAAEGSVNFSTIHLFMYEEMTVEAKDDPDNRVHKARIVENYQVKMVTPASGFLITDALT